MQTLSRKNALRMTIGSGDRIVTHYNAGVVEDARKSGVAILVVRRDKKTGKIQIVPCAARMVHRPDLCGTFGNTHEQAGEGKYISLEAYPKGNPRLVRGAQYVNPYLRTDGCYTTIVEVFKNNIGMANLAKLKSQVAYTRARSDHLLWEGKRNSDGFLVASDWMTRNEIWKLALNLNPDLLKMLRNSKSGRRDVSKHKSPREKFFTDLNVMRRATRRVDASTGEVEYSGGATPYAAPLEQCGFAIDQRFLTYGIEDGELAQYYYRMVIGRPEPHPLPKTSWSYEGIDSRIAYLNGKIQKIAKAAKAKKVA